MAGSSTVHTIATERHGRYLLDRPDGEGPFPVVIGFHGYGEGAEPMLDALRGIARGADWILVSVQALNRFYTRGDQQVVASWMTRQDRELEIADNIAYVSAVIRAVQRERPTRRPLVYAGFSQGVAMAYRAAAFAGHRCDGLIALAGDVPPDVAPKASTLPPILLGRGTSDQWYTADKAAADLSILRAAGVPVTEHVFDAGHVWEPTFIAAAHSFLERTSEPRNPRTPELRNPGT